MNLIIHPGLNGLVDEHFDSVCPKLKKSKKIVGRLVEYEKSSVKEKIQGMLRAYRGKKALPIFEYFDNNFERIIKDNVSGLRRHQLEIKKIIRAQGVSMKAGTKLFKDVTKCFDYGSYKSKGTPYDILLKLSVNACPYCNRQFINTFISKEGKARASLDHFFAQASHPYFAISFYNLIPSCHSCNSSLKGSKEFTIETHVHPFDTSFEGTARFTINYKKVKDSKKYIAEFYTDPDYLEIDFEPDSKASLVDYRKAKRNIKDLCLKPLYNLHKDLVIDLLQKHVIYSKSGYAKKLASQYPKIFNSENDVLRLVLGNYTLAGDFNKRPFSRLTRDIARELGFLDEIIK